MYHISALHSCRSCSKLCKTGALQKACGAWRTRPSLQAESLLEDLGLKRKLAQRSAVEIVSRLPTFKLSALPTEGMAGRTLVGPYVPGSFGGKMACGQRPTLRPPRSRQDWAGLAFAEIRKNWLECSVPPLPVAQARSCSAGGRGSPRDSLGKETGPSDSSVHFDQNLRPELFAATLCDPDKSTTMPDYNA